MDLGDKRTAIYISTALHNMQNPFLAGILLNTHDSLVRQ